MTLPDASILYEINTPVYLQALCRKSGKTVTLANVPESELQKLAGQGVSAVWLMGVWQRSPAGIAIGATEPGLQKLYNEVLADLDEADVIGSAYCIRNYVVDDAYGGQNALLDFKLRLASHGIKLLLDFVPNHTAPDHPWIHTNPEFYIGGSQDILSREPESFIELDNHVFANGRDPQYPAWRDVVQLNAFNLGYRQAAIDTLLDVAKLSDGVRCDMAMLMLNDIFARTWGDAAGVKPTTEYWQEIIDAVRAEYPDFVFMAEAYWDTEATLTQLGFDYCYDKTLYDCLLQADTPAITDYLKSTKSLRPHLVHFIENHDEPRAASEFTVEQEKAAAVLMAVLPGLYLFHDGQAEGYKTRIPVQLRRGPAEPTNDDLNNFYQNFAGIIKNWQLSDRSCRPEASSDPNVLLYNWSGTTGQSLAVINYSNEPKQLRFSFRKSSNQKAHHIYTDVLTGATFHAHEGIPFESSITCHLDPWQSLLLS